MDKVSRHKQESGAEHNPRRPSLRMFLVFVYFATDNDAEDEKVMEIPTLFVPIHNYSLNMTKPTREHWQIDPRTAPKNPNPKDSIGATKVPMHLWPETATVLGAMGLLDGALKYGRSNFRAAPVRASIYYDAAKRHLNAWFEGRPCDPDSGLPDLAHALACLAILVDAQAAGTLIDDRMIDGGYHKLLADMTPHVKRLQELHADKSPKHYTIEDTKP